MKKLLTLTLLTFAAGMLFLSSCDDGGENTPDGPSITAPGVTNVQTETSADVTFSVTVPGGYKSAVATGTGGTPTISSEPAAGATSGDVVVSFAAGNSAGAGTIQLTVTDNNSKTSVNNATLNITTTPPPPDPEEVYGIIDEDMTFTNDRIWILVGRVIVDAGVELTIEEGTIIKGSEGEGTLASALIVSRGATINAAGTSDNPIIFTSILDDIQLGQKVGSNLTRKDNELWGGVIILGSAKISAENGDTEASIEGIPADEEYGLYGGDNDADDSGTFTYVSIRHGGITIGEGNEINGLTLGGVGNGTTIHHVEIFATLDDGIECFGGAVNINDALVYWQGDDGVDLDQNYSGTFDNFMVMHGDGGGADDVGTDNGLEIDGPENSTHTTGLFTLKNGTVMADGGGDKAADLKSKAQGTIENVYFAGYAAGNYMRIRTSFEDFCGATKSDAYTHYTDGTPTLIIKNSEFDLANSGSDLVKVYTSSTTSDAEGAPTCDINPDDQTAAETVFGAAGNAFEVTTPTVGADKSEFEGWTAADELGLL